MGFFVQTIQYWSCFLVPESTDRLTQSSNSNGPCTLKENEHEGDLANKCNVHIDRRQIWQKQHFASVGQMLTSGLCHSSTVTSAGVFIQEVTRSGLSLWLTVNRESFGLWPYIEMVFLIFMHTNERGAKDTLRQHPNSLLFVVNGSLDRSRVTTDRSQSIRSFTGSPVRKYKQFLFLEPLVVNHPGTWQTTHHLYNYSDHQL